MSTSYGSGTKPSSEWYTPEEWMQKVEYIFPDGYHDVCPRLGSEGLEAEWNNDVYCNPPTPAKRWAERAICWHRENPSERSCLYAAFSPNVLFQVPELLLFPFVLVRKRIKWMSPEGIGDKPKQHNAFIMITTNFEHIHNFYGAFKGDGAVMRAQWLDASEQKLDTV